MPIDWNTITICATIALCSCGGGFIASQWLEKRFAELKTVLSTRLYDHEMADLKQFDAIRTRLVRVETKAEINHHDIHHAG